LRSQLISGLSEKGSEEKGTVPFFNMRPQLIPGFLEKAIEKEIQKGRVPFFHCSCVKVC
jgi:hypothetical protein